MTRAELLLRGRIHVSNWCALNSVSPPAIIEKEGREPDFGVCAYYRDGVTYIWPEACAAIGRSIRQWSYPGYIVDRTPYGVLAHELGHHVEAAHGTRGGIVASTWRRETKEPAITGYDENDNEWFAEIFRLFVTNPLLLAEIRPKMFALLVARWPKLVETREWESVLSGAEERWRIAARNKIKEAQKRATRVSRLF